MGKNEAILWLSTAMLLLLAAETSDGAAGPKPKHVKCHDNKNYPVCHKNNSLYCPMECPHTCVVDCVTCKPVCTSPPPPPPKAPKTKHVKCHDKKNFPSCYAKNNLYCPVQCPQTCVVDCANCQPVCRPPPPPPPKHGKSPPPPPTTAYPPPQPPASLVNSTTPPAPPVSSPKTARCKNKNYTKCYWTEHKCPPACPDHCEVDCAKCSPVCNCNYPGAVCQDPRFVGADGITFYFHGRKDRDFCIVSDTNLHINAHFIGFRSQHMTRDFTWIQSLGILFGSHNLSIAALRTAAWDDTADHLALSFDGRLVSLPDEYGSTWRPETAPDAVSIRRTRHVNAVAIEAKGYFEIKANVVPITERESRVHNYGIAPEEDCFAHLDLSFKFYSLSGEVDGVLGQTYAIGYVSRVKMGVAMPVLGGDEKFTSSGLFATNCAASRFGGGLIEPLSSEGLEYADLKCSSGMDGIGVICKR